MIMCFVSLANLKVLFNVEQGLDLGLNISAIVVFSAAYINRKKGSYCKGLLSPVAPKEAALGNSPPVPNMTLFSYGPRCSSHPALLGSQAPFHLYKFHISGID